MKSRTKHGIIVVAGLCAVVLAGIALQPTVRRNRAGAAPKAPSEEAPEAEIPVKSGPKPITVRQTLRPSPLKLAFVYPKDDPGPKDLAITLKVPEGIVRALPVTARQSESPFDLFSVQAFTIEGKSMSLILSGMKASKAHYARSSGPYDLDYRAKAYTTASQPVPHGWHLEGAIDLTYGAKERFIIDFDARVRLKRSEDPDLPDRVEPVDANVVWRWPGKNVKAPAEKQKQGKIKHES